MGGEVGEGVGGDAEVVAVGREAVVEDKVGRGDVVEDEAVGVAEHCLQTSQGRLGECLDGVLDEVAPRHSLREENAVDVEFAEDVRVGDGELVGAKTTSR